MSTNQKTVGEDEITGLKRRVDELQAQRTKLEEKLRTYEDREYKEKERVANEKRAAERDAMIIANIARLETLVTMHVKDPALRPAAYEHALACQLGMSPWGMFVR